MKTILRPSADVCFLIKKNKVAYFLNELKEFPVSKEVV